MPETQGKKEKKIFLSSRITIHRCKSIAVKPQIPRSENQNYMFIKSGI